MEWKELGMTALRALLVYALMLTVIRLSGKRTIGNFTAFDFLVALMLGEVVDEIIFGDVTLAQGVVAIAAVAVLQYANSWLSYWDHGLDKILEGTPTVVVENGDFRRDGMRKERVNEKDVMSELRQQGIDDVREVRLALIEPDGRFSVIRHEWAEQAQKADLLEDAAKEKERVTRGKEQPPSAQRTDSPAALGAEA